MSRFLRAEIAIIAVAMFFAYSFTLDRNLPHCKVDKVSRDLIWHLLPLSMRLGGKVFQSYATISKKWLTPSDQWKSADFPLSIPPRPLNTAALSPGSLLLADQNTLSTFLSLMRNSTAEFQGYPNGTAVVHHLRNLEAELRFMITILRRLERVFNFGSRTPTNVSVLSVTSGSQNPATAPVFTSHNPTGTSNSTVPTIHRVALRLSVILDDLYSSLLEMDADFNKIRNTECS